MGVQILNKDVSVISSIANVAKARISNVGGIVGWAGATGFVSGDLLFNDISYSISPTGNTQTSPKTGTLYLDFAVSTNEGVTEIFFNKNGTDVVNILLSAPEPTLQWTIPVTAGDILYFYLVKTGPPFSYDDGTMTIRNLDSSGVIIDTFFLTSVE